MLVNLSYSGHDPNRIVEITEGEYKRILEVQGNKYLYDTEEGRAIIEKLEALPEIEAPEIILYI
jgi:hypothetical protein